MAKRGEGKQSERKGARTQLREVPVVVFHDPTRRTGPAGKDAKFLVGDKGEKEREREREIEKERDRQRERKKEIEKERYRERER